MSIDPVTAALIFKGVSAASGVFSAFSAFTKKPAALPSVPVLQTPSQPATVRKKDTGAQIRIGADAAKAVRNRKAPSNTTGTRGTSKSGLSLSSGTGVGGLFQ